MEVGAARPRHRGIFGGLMRVLGLTGGIASGKSTAATQLKELGAIVLDADRGVVRLAGPED